MFVTKISSICYPVISRPVLVKDGVPSWLPSSPAAYGQDLTEGFMLMHLSCHRGDWVSQVPGGLVL